MSNKTAIKSVIQNQMQEFAKQLAGKYSQINETEALTMANSLVENLEVQIPRRARVDDGKPRFYKQSGYGLFAKEIRDTVIRENPGCKFGEISSKTGLKWKALTKEQQEQYNEKAKTLPPVLVKQTVKKTVDPNVPRYVPVSGYNLFTKENREEIKKKNPDAKFGVMSHLISVEWKALTDAQREEWNVKAKALPPVLVKPKVDENAPKMKHISGYMLFCKEIRASIVAEFPGISFGEIGQKQSAKWNTYTQSEKDIWNEKAKALPPVEIKARKVKKVKPENAEKPKKSNGIKKPSSAFQLFYIEHRDNMKLELSKSNPEISNNEIKSQVSDMWKALPKEQKNPYIDEANKLKEEYKIKIAALPKEEQSASTDDDEKVSEISQQLKDTSLENQEQDDEQDDEQEVETVPVVINKITYYLDKDTNNLYNEEGEYVGTYKDGKISQ